MPWLASSQSRWLRWQASMARLRSSTGAVFTKRSGATGRPSWSRRPCGKAWYSATGASQTGRGGSVTTLTMPRLKAAVTTSRQTFWWSSM